MRHRWPRDRDRHHTAAILHAHIKPNLGSAYDATVELIVKVPPSYVPSCICRVCVCVCVLMT